MIIKACVQYFLFFSSNESRNFSLVARYSLKFTRCPLLVTKSLVTCCKIRSLVVAEVARCKKNSLLVAKFTRCSLQKITRYLLPISLVSQSRSCSMQKFTRYSLQNSHVTHCKKSLAACCEIRSLLIAEVARC